MGDGVGPAGKRENGTKKSLAGQLGEWDKWDSLQIRMRLFQLGRVSHSATGVGMFGNGSGFRPAVGMTLGGWVEGGWGEW